MSERLAESTQIVSGFVPFDLQGSSGGTGDWVSMKNYNHLAIVFFAAAGTAGDDPTLTIEQAQAVAGTNAKALNFTTIYVKQGTLTAEGTFTKATQSAGNTYTDATSAEIQKIWIVEFNAEDLDVENGFDCVRGSVADVGGNAQIGALLYILTCPRYTPPPSAIVD